MLSSFGQFELVWSGCVCDICVPWADIEFAMEYGMAEADDFPNIADDPYTPSYPVKIEVGVVPNGCIVASPLPFE